MIIHSINEQKKEKLCFYDDNKSIKMFVSSDNKLNESSSQTNATVNHIASKMLKI